MVKLTYTGEVRRNFDVGETIGRGSFATVKLCTDIMTKQQFALKVVNKGDPAFEQKNLAEEVDAMMRVSHPNCVHLHGVFEEKEKIYLVLDLVTGGTLMDRIIEMNHFSEKDAIHVTRDILLAVEYLHSIGITHRDLKPENLLYASGDPSSPDYNTIKIADFGLAKVMSGRSTMSTPCGTPNYVAPEVIDPARGSKVYGPEIDIWSVGVIVYVMLCGFPPFYQTSTPALFKEICKGEFSFPSPYWDGISQQAKNFVMKTIVKKPRQRMQASECLQHEWIKKGLPHSLSAGSVHSFHKAFLLLRKLDIFESIDPMLLNEIAKVLKTVRARKGEYIIRAGDLGNSMYFVHSGFVEVSVNGNKVDMLTAGDFFGEVALTVAAHRTADVIALGSMHKECQKGSEHVTELFQLMKSDLEDIVCSYPLLESRLERVGKARVRRASCSESPERRELEDRSNAPPSPRSSHHKLVESKRNSLDGMDTIKKTKSRRWKACIQQ